jgi:hypothetical protein
MSGLEPPTWEDMGKGVLRFVGTIIIVVSVVFSMSLFGYEFSGGSRGGDICIGIFVTIFAIIGIVWCYAFSYSWNRFVEERE